MIQNKIKISKQITMKAKNSLSIYLAALSCINPMKLVKHFYDFIDAWADDVAAAAAAAGGGL